MPPEPLTGWQDLWKKRYLMQLLLDANTCEPCPLQLAASDYFQLRRQRKWAMLIPDSTFMLINLLNKPLQESLYFFFWLRRELINFLASSTECCISQPLFNRLFQLNFPAFRLLAKSFFSPPHCDGVIFHRKWETSPGKWLSLKSNRNRAQFHFQDKKKKCSASALSSKS